MTVPCTILIPTKDRPELLRRAIKSALLAAPADAEILIVDDKSDPPAQNILAEFDDHRLIALVNDGPNGAAAARNFGLKTARGRIVFFLDDDDELLPEYCSTILNSVAVDHPSVDYGFSAVLVAGRKEGEEVVGNNKLPHGVIARTEPFRRRICPFSAGFWIRRSVFEELGPIDESLATNEDTEYLCRLIDAEKTAWFSAQPGVRIHTHGANTPTGTLGHVTTRTHSTSRAQYFLTIYKRHKRLVQADKSARRHLARRYIKLSTKSGRLRESWDFAGALPSLPERISARYYALVNFTAYRLSGKHSKT
ncbi:glycosyltransferase family 2 protein [Profundibacter sp.]